MTTEVKVKRPNSWILFLKEYSKEHNVSYSSLIGDKKIKELYIASKNQPVLDIVPEVVITEKVKKEKVKKEKKPKKVKVSEEVIVVE